MENSKESHKFDSLNSSKYPLGNFEFVDIMKSYADSIEQQKHVTKDVSPPQPKQDPKMNCGHHLLFSPKINCGHRPLFSPKINCGRCPQSPNPYLKQWILARIEYCTKFPESKI